ncbi:MAG TPA: glucodextranase DOMON-like domain-containing protein [Jatrophihabitans sp.]|uniref:glucodextranase DOMON-like domain-containing protein n=1 Tax=Jatrophihabitans sp. TaxID=1932789 RepID=UPI002E0AA6EC|nr:glucodextranase DOMON-like domain-containing protein [Jatrophihabitans sp.]
MLRRPSRLRSALVLSAAAVAVAGQLVATSTGANAAAAATVAPGAPGTLSRFDLARKDCVGTARNTTSKVWFTVANGVLSDVYEPTIDNTNVQSLEFVVTDGRTFSDLQTRDMTYSVKADPTGMTCTVTATSARHGYTLTTTYLADPSRDTVVLRTSLNTGSPTRRLAVYARLDSHVNGNGGGGSANGGADSGTVDASGVAVVGDTATVSQADNRDYAVPTFMALDATTLHRSSVGYEGSASDGLTQLDATHSLTQYTSAPNGHVVATADVTPPGSSRSTTLALGFGRTQQQAVSTAAATLGTSSVALTIAYLRRWVAYDAGLNRPRGVTLKQLAAYYVSANVLKASVDKTFPGALVASLASPWGQAVSAGDLPGGKPVYFGSYREVFSRDLYEGVTGMLADGDIAEARAATRFLFERQQQVGGQMPRNSLLNGRTAPDTGGDQLDETAYPILMAYLTGLGSDATLYSQHIVKAADFLVSHGPSFGNERWEEQGGYSPSTIAAEIAGLTAAATIARSHGDTDKAELYQATADQFQRTIKSLAVTHHGPYSSSPYFIRLSKNGDPNSEYLYSLGNGSVTVDQRAVVDGGFQELVRLGELPPTDPDIVNSLAVLDKQISVATPTGTGYYRYGTDAKNGSTDGYGDCYVPDPTDCPRNGQPWPTTDKGSGHLWPVLSGERAESALAQGDTALANSQLAFMLASASGEGLVPEQAWEDPNLAADPYGSDPTTASIGFQDGHAAGSASPLTWAQAQELRLITDLGAGRITDRPDITTARYVTHGAPGAVPVTITAPASGESVSGTTAVSGTTTPGAHVVVSSIGTDTPSSDLATATADGSGAYNVAVPVSFGTDIITVASTTSTGTGYAQVTVVGDLIGGTSVLVTTDPANDDNGPGTYQYPTASDFTPGSFDITRFQVLTKSGTVYLRVTLRNLKATFGSTLGAQLFDIYVHRPGATTTSTSASHATRNYSIGSSDAWSQRLEVQGFAAPIWDDPNGNPVGAVTAVVSSTIANTVTIALPEAQFGTPSTGWSFVLALTGQDGSGGGVDQARTFAPTPQPYNFGVCAAGNGAPICSLDPNTVPKVLDTIPPAGVAQADELDPTKGAVVLRGVAVP